MIFETEIQAAKKRSAEMEASIRMMTAEYEHVKSKLNFWRAECARSQLSSMVKHITTLRKRVERMEQWLEAANAQKFELDFWILRKEEIWRKVSRETLEEQIREIHAQAEKLSTLILGRKVDIVFETKAQAPLGAVPILKHAKGRKIHLSIRLLEEQPEHLLDYYKGLIIHELGHLLLHIGKTSREYRKLRRLIQQRITGDETFFKVFNILLDDQLERRLRDVEKEWRTWFHRLAFFSGSINLNDLQSFLARNQTAEVDLTPYIEKRYLKVYGSRSLAFARILSAEFLTAAHGFSRLFAFYYVLRQGLPLKTISEDWLRDCISYIPRNFTNQDLIDVHRLAVRIYRRMIENCDPIPLFHVHLAGGRVEDLVFPGTWKTNDRNNAISLHHQEPVRKAKHGSLPLTFQKKICVPDPEGEPVKKKAQETKQIVLQRARTYGGSGGLGIGSYYTSLHPSPTEIRRSVPKTTREILKQKLRSGHLSAKEKTRLQKQIDAEDRQKEQARLQTLEAKEKQKAVPVRENSIDRKDHDSGKQMEDRAVPENNLSIIHKSLANSMNEILKQVINEEQNPIASPIERMHADTAPASDYKNKKLETSFPPIEKVHKLMPDAAKNCEVVQRIRKYAVVVRTYFRRYEDEREMEEQLRSGRRILGSGLLKLAMYGENRIFRDQRVIDLENYNGVHVSVLIDTSASMGKDGRLDRAKDAAALLAECFCDCKDIESLFIGYNQNVYLCGTHDAHSFVSLAPAGKTNEAGALDFLKKQFGLMSRRNKLVVVLSDGLPTSCSVESVRLLVNEMSTRFGFTFLYGALSKEVHPAYRLRLNLQAGNWSSNLISFGKAIARLVAA